MQLADAGKLIIFIAVMTAIIIAFAFLARMNKKLPKNRRFFSPLLMVDQLRTKEFYVFLLLALFVLVLVHLVLPML